MTDTITSIQQAGLETEAYARSLGAEIYAVASADRYEELFPRKPPPSKFVDGAKSVIIVGLPHSREIMDTVAMPWLAEIHESGADTAAMDSLGRNHSPAGAERYYLDPETDMLAHEVSMIGYRLARKLHRDGHRAFYIPEVKTEPRFKTAPFYFLPAMYVAGLGQLGMNCSIITPKWGPRFRVTAVITDLELPAGEPMEEMNFPGCETCRDCVKRCPSKALDGKYWKNVYRCAAYGCCATCLSVCPEGND
jgi:epoxyqueuosine reductase QueG